MFTYVTQTVQKRWNLKSLISLFRNFLLTYKLTLFLKTQRKGITLSLTNKETDNLASYLGYVRSGPTVKGKPVYQNGRRFIVQDIDSHIGGIWKMADSINNLKSKATRLGTYDALLNYMGE